MKAGFYHTGILLVFLFIAASPAETHAQQSNTFYLMQKLPQSHLMNPAVQISCRYMIGIPVLGSMYLHYGNTAFTYNDLAADQEWDLEGVQEQMHRRDLYALEMQTALVSLGYRHRDQYFSFHIQERGLAFQTLPDDLATLAILGNGPMVGETATLNALRPGAIHAREYSMGMSRRMGPFLTAGIRAKLLFGKASVSTGWSDLSLHTAPDNFDLHMHTDYRLNTSYPYTLILDDDGNPEGVEFTETDPVDYLLNRRNPGFALDLGIIYALSEKTTLSASLLDLGLVRWRSDPHNFVAEGSFVYRGADLSSELGTAEFISEALDTIFSYVDVTSTERAYTSTLPPQLFLAADYAYTDWLNLGLVNRNVFFRSKWHASLTLSATAHVASAFLGTVSWSYLNNSVKNLGLGIAWHGKGLQFHAVTDNILAAFYPFDTRTINLRLGINLLLGCPRNRQDRMALDSRGRMAGDGICPYPEHTEKKKKRHIRAAKKRNR